MAPFKLFSYSTLAIEVSVRARPISVSVHVLFWPMKRIYSENKFSLFAERAPAAPSSGRFGFLTHVAACSYCDTYQNFDRPLLDLAEAFLILCRLLVASGLRTPGRPRPSERT
ncbi:hypothetical protein EVAR_92852_1 [Eumeta japonica]|uniref:Uncharacterized protein n=1 Tax=Eumeta variegata TaxID=151549 RepID=A0A4C1TDE1_EUMVA|nr:hypothetical protein EVAR_92852_1 [Eumeta japonica]